MGKIVSINDKMSLTYLINPSEKNILDNAGDRMPIGLMSIASNNKNMKVYDLNHTKEVDLLRDFIYKLGRVD